MLSGQQRVHAQSGCGCQFAKTAPLELMGHEHVALFRRKFIQRRIDFFQKQLARVGRLGTSLGRRQVFPRKPIGLFRDLGGSGRGCLRAARETGR